MLTIGDPQRLNRRGFLTAGGLALGGLSLADMLALKAHGATNSKLLKDKSVVFVFMHGGPSQIETFDPKMDQPVEIASATGEVSTKLPGITFGGTFPRLAQLADRMSIVRSFTTGDGNHDIKPIVGRDTAGANLGSLYARVAGQNRPHDGMPTNVTLYPQAVDNSTMPPIKQFGDFESPGSLGGGYAPFAPSGGGELRQNMKLALPMNRLDERRLLLTGLDRLKRSFDAQVALASMGTLQAQAFQTILGGVADAFDLSKENPMTIARYDTAPLVRPDQIDKKWKNYERYVDNAKSLGRLMLLARRLCERGCGFVTVTTNFVWDMHSDVNNAGVEEGFRYMGLPFDHAISAFLEDVESRGLSEKILLVCCGEMGRSPRINATGGRDHWGNLAPLMLAGGGLKMGQVIGQSKRDASEPRSEPVTIKNLVATVLDTLINVGELRLVTGISSDVLKAATAAEPISGLS